MVLETGNELASVVSVHDVPHLVLTHLAMSFRRKLVVGMYLDGKVLLCVNHFDQQGEVFAETSGIGFSKKSASEAFYYFGKAHAFVTAFAYDRFVTFYCRGDPCL